MTLLKTTTAALLLIGAPAAADTPPATVAELATLNVTASRRETTAQELPTPVTVVTKDTLQRQPATLWTDHLKGQTGVSVQSTTPGQATPILRGLKGSEVLHLVDGIRLNHALFRNAPNNYLGLVDPFEIERIEALRGPAGALYGADAMGGVVQLITPTPVFTGADWQQHTQLLARTHSATLSREGHVRTAVGRKNLAVSLSGGYQDFADLRTAHREAQTPSAYEAGGGGVKLHWTPGTHQLTVSSDIWHQPGTPRYDAVAGGPGGSGNREYAWFEPNTRTFHHLRWQLPTKRPGLDKLDVHIARQVMDDDRREKKGSDDFETREQNRSTLDALTLQASWLRNEWLDLVYGLELYHDTVQSTRQRHVVNGATAGTVSARTPRFPDGATQDSRAAYVQNTLHVGNDLDLQLGLRHSRFATRLPQADAGQDVNLTMADSTGGLGLLYRISPALNLIANAGRGFRAPNVFDLGSFGSSNGGKSQIIPNSALRPESVWTYDLGLKWQGERAGAEVVVWSSDFANRITSRLISGSGTVDDPYIEQNQNAASAHYRGLEAGLQYRWRDDLHGYGSLNSTFGEETDGNGETTPANRVPPLNLQGGLRWIARPTLVIEPWLRHVAAQRRLAASDAADVRIGPRGTDAWTTANLHVRWTPAAPLAVSLDAENLADARYREHGSGIDAPGRSLALTLEWLLD